jgi:hypothetical protein
MKFAPFAVALVVASLAGAAFAAPLVVDGANNSPVQGDCTFACLDRYQQVYDSSLFSRTQVVTAIDFRYSSNGYSWSTGNQYRLTIGIAAFGVGALSANQNTNFLSSQVFDLESFSGTTTAGAWYGFSGSYTYDASLGDLLIDIQRISGGTSSIGSDYNRSSGGEFGRTYSGVNWAPETSAYVNQDYGNVTRFNLEDAGSVPEPASLALMGMALLGLAVARRTRRS